MMDLTALHLLRPWWLLALLPLGLLWMLLSPRRHDTGEWERACDPHLLPHLLIPGRNRSSCLPRLAALLAGILTILALAGPAWQRLEQPVFRQESALVILFDLSRSMAAGDIKPDRLTRARQKITDILRQRSEGQTALIAFAGRPFAVTPLTRDRDTILSQLPSLDTAIMPSQGSRIDLALHKALDLLQQAGATQGEILLITDGADPERSLSAARTVAEQGYRLLILGIGSAEGAPIPVAGGGFLKNTGGAIVISRLDSAALQQLAAAGAGRYQALTADDRDIDALLPLQGSAALNQTMTATDLKADTWREEGPWLLLLILPLAAGAFRRGSLLVLLFVCLGWPSQAQAWTWDDLWARPDQQAARMLEAGDAAEAASRFDDRRWKAAAHYQAGEFQAALESLPEDPQANDLYNQGNALARLGRYPEALTAYDQALQKDPEHQDARFNRDLVQQQLAAEQQPHDAADQNGGEEQNPSADEPKQNNSGNQQQGSDGQSKGAEGTDQEEHGDATDDQTSTEQPADRSPAPRKTEGAENGDRPPEPSAEDEATPSEAEENEGADTPQQLPLPDDRSVPSEQQQEMEQWLRRIPDDPGGLLRRKFLYQYRNQNPENEDQAW